MPSRMTTRFAALHESVPKAKSKHVRHHVGNRGESGLVVLKMSSSPSDPSATLSWQGTSDFPWLSTDCLDTSRFVATDQFVTTIID